jgi:hypothetical protein
MCGLLSSYTGEPAIMDVKLTDQDAFDILTAGIKPGGPKSGNKFAQKLIESAKSKGFDNESRMHWIRKLAIECLSQAQPGHAKPAAVVALDCEDLFHHLEAADTALQAAGKKTRPQLTFDLPAPIGRLCFTLNGSKAKRPGNIKIDDGEKWPNAAWYGEIDCKTRTWTPTKAVVPEVIEEVKKIAASPATYAGAYGISYQRCCFCKKAITTKKSKAVGYGPVCAKHYNLPWGEKVDALIKKNKPLLVLNTPGSEKGAQIIGTLKEMPHIDYAATEAEMVKQIHKMMKMKVDQDSDLKDSFSLVYNYADAEVKTDIDDGPDVTAKEAGFNCESCLDEGVVVNADGTINDCNCGVSK